MSHTEEVVADIDHNQSVVIEEERHNVGKYVGQCKWFNDNYGYGFLTVCEGEEKGKDVFVHHSGVCPLNSNYRTLKKGEYLTFDIETGFKGLQAINVKGINGGPLMCDCQASTKPRNTPYEHERLFDNKHEEYNEDTCDVDEKADTPHAPRHVTGKLANIPPHMYVQGQWLVKTQSGRVKNLAKYSKEGRIAMKQAKQNGFVPPYRKHFHQQVTNDNPNASNAS